MRCRSLRVSVAVLLLVAVLTLPAVAAERFYYCGLHHLHGEFRAVWVYSAAISAGHRD